VEKRAALSFEELQAEQAEAEEVREIRAASLQGQKRTSRWSAQAPDPRPL
jgi:hypothetical protein